MFSDMFFTPERKVVTVSIYITLYTPERYQDYSDFIEFRLSEAIKGSIDLSPSVAKAYKKHDKATRTKVLDRALAEEELYTKYKAEAEKIRRKSSGDRQIQSYRTIYIGDARLKAIARNKAEEAAIEAIYIRKEESLRKKTEKAEGVARRKVERNARAEAKQVEKATKKTARLARLSQIVHRTIPNSSSTSD
jgi:hypothetical protein